jgi:hypothetical protein
MSHRRRTPHEDAGDTAVLAGAQSPPDRDQFSGVDPGPGYDGKHDEIEPKGEAVNVTFCDRPGSWLTRADPLWSPMQLPVLLPYRAHNGMFGVGLVLVIDRPRVSPAVLMGPP